MSTLIAYATSSGTTGKIAQLLAELIDDGVSLIDLQKKSKIDLLNYNTVIVGGSIHAGQIQRKVKKFCQENLKTLKEKRLGLFLCCMEEGDTAEKQFTEAYPEELRKHAYVCGLFGGEFILEKMNFLQKAIVKKVAKVTQNVSKIKNDRIKQFAETLNKGN